MTSWFESAINGLRRQGIKYDLERIQALSERFEHPQHRFRSLHIAGTNGKGSTAALLESVLRAAGYRVGLNTSPHLVNFRERIRVNGHATSDDELGALFQEMRPMLEDIGASFFEACTMLAFLHFARVEVDVAVVEVGLGGRLDATNVLKPVGTIITCLDLEHTKTLGSTLPEIAREKGGVIKQNPVVTGVDQPSALAEIRRIARERGAPLIEVAADRDWRYRERRLDWGPGRELLELGMAGRHQAQNAALVLALLERLAETGSLPTTPAQRRTGLARARLAGRYDERELNGRSVIFDVAHNVSGARVLARTLAERHPGRRFPVVLGMLRDKPHDPVLAELAPVVDHLWVTTPGHTERRFEAANLGAIAASRGLPVTVIPRPGDAVRAALEVAGPVVVTGSLFTVGSAMSDLGIHPADEMAGYDPTLADPVTLGRFPERSS
jgi:dihydrofolate synthase/folylpolyglutamate synthase